MRKRERIEIIYDVLNSIMKKGKHVKPTHILYKSNLSSQMLKEYLSELKEKEFIIEHADGRGRKSYELTDKGYKYIQDFSIIRNFMESYGLSD